MDEFLKLKERKEKLDWILLDLEAEMQQLDAKYKRVQLKFQKHHKEKILILKKIRDIRKNTREMIEEDLDLILQKKY